MKKGHHGDGKLNLKIQWDTTFSIFEDLNMLLDFEEKKVVQTNFTKIIHSWRKVPNPPFLWTTPLQTCFYKIMVYKNQKAPISQILRKE